MTVNVLDAAKKYLLYQRKLRLNQQTQKEGAEDSTSDAYCNQNSFLMENIKCPKDDTKIQRW